MHTIYKRVQSPLAERNTRRSLFVLIIYCARMRTIHEIPDLPTASDMKPSYRPSRHCRSFFCFKGSFSFLTAGALLAVILFLFPEEAHALRCGKRLVSGGDRTFEVSLKCGEPLLIEEWSERSVIHVNTVTDRTGRHSIPDPGQGYVKSSSRHTEEWTYNFGSNRFIHYLTFINGKLKSIEEGPRGFNEETLSDSVNPRCGLLVEKGDRKIEVLKKCGNPNEIDYLWEEHTSKILNRERTRTIPRYVRDRQNRYRKNYTTIRELITEERWLFVNIEEWSYNFGPSRFLFFIRFENGKVVHTETGGKGY